MAKSKVTGTTNSGIKKLIGANYKIVRFTTVEINEPSRYYIP